MKKPEDSLFLKFSIQGEFFMLGNNNFTSFFVMGQNGADFAFTDICAHRYILGREIGTETDDDSLNVFRYGLSLRH